MERREILKAGGITGATLFLGGLYATTRGGSNDPESPDRTPAGSETATGTDRETERPGTETTESGPFDTVVDAVEAGADPDGEEPVTFLFEEHAADATLLAFEPGTYKIDFFTVSDLTEFGVVGTGDEPARFVPAAGDCRGGHPWVAFDGVDDLLLENVRFDFRESESGGPVHLLLGGDSVVRDVTYLGSCSNQISMFKIAVVDAEGTAEFERVAARNVDDNQSLTGIFVNGNHTGSVTFRDCTAELCSDNGLYASDPGGAKGGDGAVHVVGGTYRNNNIAGVRLGSTGATARDVTVVVDSETPGWGSLNARGIRLRNRAGQLIENCEIRFGSEAADSFGGVVFHPANGGGLVRETSIRIDRDAVPAIRAFPVEASGDAAPRFEDVSITGSAADGFAGRIAGRDNTVFENCTVDQTGAGRAGINFVDSRDCRIADSRLTVTERPVVVENGTVEIENTQVTTARGEEQIEYRLLEDETLTVRAE